MKDFVRHLALASGCLTLTLSLCVPLVAALPQQSPPADPAAVDPVVAIAKRVQTEIAAMKPTATAADYEAAIVFALGQSGGTVADQIAAVDSLGGPDVKPELNEALRNVRAQLTKKKLRRGTGAINGNNNAGGNGSSSSFSAPIVDVAGGTSNYSQ